MMKNDEKYENKQKVEFLNARSELRVYWQSYPGCRECGAILNLSQRGERELKLERCVEKRKEYFKSGDLEPGSQMLSAWASTTSRAPSCFSFRASKD